jgi:hypothetical protein
MHALGAACVALHTAVTADVTERLSEVKSDVDVIIEGIATRLVCCRATIE